MDKAKKQVKAASKFTDKPRKKLNNILTSDRSKVPLLHRLPMTRVKLLFARIIYYILRTFLHSAHHRIRRRGVWYEVDLTEGIDLSLFLFGNFQSNVTSTKYVSLPSDAVILDIGANIGSMSFRFAQHAPRGYVYVFEPTDYAFAKLLRNLSLNPELAQRITAVQTFVSDTSTECPQITAYSSWKIDGTASDAHPVHGGSIQPADGVGAITLDDFCRRNHIHKVDLIKIDTDGHEFRVLQGARKCVEQFRPYIVFEIGIYLMQEYNVTFEQYFEYFSSYDYVLINSKNGRAVTLENYHKEIPLCSGTDILAIPPRQ